MIKVLLIDDDIELSSMLSEYFTAEGFLSKVVHEGYSGIKEALSGNYDIAIIDVMMPGINGFEVLAKIRLESQLPILMLTARGDDVDRIAGLEMGADDYVSKPATPRELVARIRAIMKRINSNNKKQKGAIVVGSLILKANFRSIEQDGKHLNLTSTEFNLLEVLMRNAGRVVSKEDLAEQGLARPLVRFDRSIDVHMSSIRQKLGSRVDGISWIQTVRSRGYQLTPE